MLFKRIGIIKTGSWGSVKNSIRGVQPLRICFAGALLNSDNMGCIALTYSAVRFFESLSCKMNRPFTYVFLDANYDEAASSSSLEWLCREIKIDKSRVNVLPAGNFSSILRRIYRCKNNRNAKRAVQNADIFFDLTQGDSFSDIYGMKRLRNFSKLKLYARTKGKKVIFGPQTIGPFERNESRCLAKKALGSANLIFVRDLLSSECVRSLGAQSHVATDLAFLLPYKKTTKLVDGLVKLKVGLNISGLLVAQAYEGDFDGSRLKCDYDALVEKLLEALTSDNNYEIHLIPHVLGPDLAAMRMFEKRFPKVIVHDEVRTPIEAKSVISAMDAFVGSRMHATIAALSAGVPVVPLGYSRKFEGLFCTIGYSHSVDMCSFGTQECLEIVLDKIKNREALIPDVKQSLQRVNELMGSMERIILTELL